METKINAKTLLIVSIPFVVISAFYTSALRAPVVCEPAPMVAAVVQEAPAPEPARETVIETVTILEDPSSLRDAVGAEPAPAKAVEADKAPIAAVEVAPQPDEEDELLPAAPEAVEDLPETPLPPERKGPRWDDEGNWKW